MRTTPPGDPDYTGFLFTAGHAQYTADPSGGVPEAWRAAARIRTGLADLRLRAAWAWGDAAATAGDADDAAAGFAAAVALLPVLAWRPGPFGPRAAPVALVRAGQRRLRLDAALRRPASRGGIA